MPGLRVDITEGAYEFHRDDDGNVTFVQHGATLEVVTVPADVWQRNWSKLVSLAEFRELVD